MRKKILFQSDFSLGKTGFGRNAKAILSHLYKTDKYDIVHYCCGTPYSAPQHQMLPWKSIGCLPDNPAEMEQINKDPALAKRAAYGEYYLDRIMKEEKPDVYIAAQDIWGVDFAIYKPWYPKIHSVIWTTLDSLPILPSALEAAKRTKHFWTWSSFAEDEMRKLGHDHVKTVHGAVDSDVFYRLNDARRSTLRNLQGISNKSFIVGFVFRNQLRKSVPNLLEGFKIFQDRNPTVSAKLLLHTHFGEGWNIPRLAREYGVNDQDILTTYICRGCNKYVIQPYQGLDLDCHLCKAEKSLITTNVGQGVTEEQLNEIYNLMDVYCHPFTSGGQEIPIQEAKLTELITLVTDYSCGEESCEKGSGSIPLEWSEYREVGTQFRKASTCPNSIAKNLDKVFRMLPEEREKLGKQARKWAIENYSTEVTGKIIEEFIDSAPFANFDFDSLEWKARNPKAKIPNIEDDSEWLTYLYKNILNMNVNQTNDGHKYWMKQIANKTPRKNIENFFRNKAEEENKENLPFKIEELLDKNDKGKRILVVMPGSIGDVFMSTSVLESLAKTYKNYNIYFATAPEYFEVLDANPFVHKTIPYNPKMDDLLWLEGRGKHEGFFEIAYLLHLGTQRMFNYQHNGKDIVALDLLNN